jgi:nucleoside-diphosphate-sugar epimerase
LMDRGHQVVGTTRATDKLPALHATGAQPVVMNGLDRSSVFKVVQTTKPEVIVHQMSSLASAKNLKHFDREFETTNRLRTEGTAHLIAAARQSGARRLVVQSFTGWPNAPTGKPVNTEDNPLDPTPPRTMRRTLQAIRELERSVLAASDLQGIVLRYGFFYGPGTAISPQGEVAEMVRKRKFPIIGSGSGLLSWIHIADVAQATALAVEGAPSGLYNIVDDEPAPMSVWLPELARLLDAKPPRHVPEWIARLKIGEAGVHIMTGSPGSSNAKAKRVLNWTPMYASWREGFRHEFQMHAARQVAAG